MAERMTFRGHQHARAIRTAGWVFFGLLAAVRVAISFIPLSTAAHVVLGDCIIYLLPVLLGTVGVVLLAWATAGIERRFWALLGLGSALILVGEVYFTWYTAVVDLRGPPIESPHMLLHAAAAILMFGVVVSMTTFGSAPWMARMRFYVDVVAGAMLAHAVIYAFVMRPLFAGVYGDAWGPASISAAYPIVGVSMLIATGVVVFGRGSRRLQGWERLVAASIALFSVALSVMPWSLASHADASRPPQPMYLTIALGLGYYLLFMATVYRWTAGGSAAIFEPWPVPKARPSWLPALYPIALAAALPLLGVWAIAVADTAYGAPIVATSMALAALLVVRSWLLGLERSYHRGAAITDPASGAYNHRYLHERLTAQIAQATAYGRILSVGVFDVDSLHVATAMQRPAADDPALVGLVRVMTEEAGPDAIVYRLSGGEFAFVADGADAEQATDIAQRTIARVGREIAFDELPVHLSAGIAVFPTHAFDSEQIVARAVAAQQVAKASDDIRVVVYDETVVGASDPVERLARARRHSHRATVKALAAAVDARDSDTRHHSENVADLATALAVVLGLSEQQTHVIELAAQMHDVGKIGVRDEVLLKVEPLTAGDRALIEQHPALGERILAAARLDDILPAVRSHHERWDGRGYPDGLSGYEIPLVARLLSVCDAFEAMTSVRRNRPALSIPKAIGELERGAGHQFDPDLAHVFARMVGRLHGQAVRGTFSED